MMRPKTWMAGRRPAQTQLEARDFKRSGVLFLKALVLDDVEARIDQLAAQQSQRRLVIELEVVEGVGEDLGHPDEARLDVAEEEQLHVAEQKPTAADHEPDLGYLPDEIGR